MSPRILPCAPRPMTSSASSPPGAFRPRTARQSRSRTIGLHRLRANGRGARLMAKGYASECSTRASSQTIHWWGHWSSRFRWRSAKSSRSPRTWLGICLATVRPPCLPDVGHTNDCMRRCGCMPGDEPRKQARSGISAICSSQSATRAGRGPGPPRASCAPVRAPFGRSTAVSSGRHQGRGSTRSGLVAATTA